MRYIFLIYSRETDRASMSAEEEQAIRAQHRAVQDEAARKGVLHAAQPLQRTNTATSVRMQDGKALIVDGPFAETKELVAGYWIWKVKSMDEAVAWIKRCPNPDNTDGEIELRPIFEMEDFVALAPELRAQEERQRAQVEQLNKGTKQ
jgi:hypothetical protein